MTRYSWISILALHAVAFGHVAAAQPPQADPPSASDFEQAIARRATLGARIAEPPPAGDEPATGALVQWLLPEGSADKAGIEVGDIIVQFGDETIEKAEKVVELVGQTEPGTATDVVVVRNGTRLTLTVQF